MERLPRDLDPTALAELVSPGQRCRVVDALRLDRRTQTGKRAERGLHAAWSDPHQAWLVVVEVGGVLHALPIDIGPGPTIARGSSREVFLAASGGRFRIEHFVQRVQAPGPQERPIVVDQTHRTVIVGDAWAVKWQRHLEVSPAADRMRALMAAAVLDEATYAVLTPQPVGAVEWRAPDGSWLLVASATQFVPGAVDGWDWAVDDLRRASRGEDVATTQTYARIGQRLARLHAAFAAPEVRWASPEDIASLHESAVRDLELACELVDGDSGDRLRACAHLIRAQLARILDVHQGPLIPLHGDLHIGQILRSPGGELLINDFDGNPVLSAAERLEVGPPSRDVAGMLASIDHVARVVIHRTTDVDRAFVESWIPVAQRAFLDGYRRTLAELGLHDFLVEPWLRPFVLQQECREYVYAIRHLPHWRYVPDAALASMWERDPW